MVARLLAERVLPVRVFALAEPKDGSDAARARLDCPLEAALLEGFVPEDGSVVVDALFGAGLAKPLAGAALAAVNRVAAAGCPVLAVDLPSGIRAKAVRSGRRLQGRTYGEFLSAEPGHLLLPAWPTAAKLVVCPIWHFARVSRKIGPGRFRTGP